MSNQKYIRQTALPQVGEIGQGKLSRARLLVIGCGGLGNAILPYLASSGIGTIGIVDGDSITESNLHRQVLFSQVDIGSSKVEVAKKRLNSQFSDIEIITFNTYLNGNNAIEIVKKFDVIVDATDNIEVRYLINDACIITNKPFIHASVYRFQFQVSTFNVNGSGTYRCLYPEPPKTVQSCAEAGVMPSTVAMAGLYQANEVFKLILNIGDLLINKLLLVDTLTNKQHDFKYHKKDTDFVSEEFFHNEYIKNSVKKIAFKDALKRNGVFLDVREPNEIPKVSFENCVQIPISELEDKQKELTDKTPIFIFCQSGKRSALAFQILKEKEFKDVYCLNENAPELSYEEKENRIHSR